MKTEDLTRAKTLEREIGDLKRHVMRLKAMPRCKVYLDFYSGVPKEAINAAAEAAIGEIEKKLYECQTELDFL